MTPYYETILCDGCGIEITWSPIIAGNHKYCCQDCRDGFPCDCGNRMDMDDYNRSEKGAILQSLPY